MLSCITSRSFNLVLTQFIYLIFYLWFAETDTHFYRNLLGPICSVTGGWVTTVTTAAELSLGSVRQSVSSTHSELLWHYCRLWNFQPGLMGMDNRHRACQSQSQPPVCLSVKLLSLCWLWFTHTMFLCVQGLLLCFLKAKFSCFVEFLVNTVCSVVINMPCQQCSYSCLIWDDVLILAC